MSDKIDWRKKLSKDQVFTVPNILSFFRLALIPVIVWVYCKKAKYFLTLLLVALSGVTDIVDGIIARKFNQITDFGKFIDPVADKLTQMALLVCLLTRFPLMGVLLAIMLVKEIVAFILRLIVFSKTEKVDGAEWHGKITTVLLYLVMAVHIIWYAIPSAVSTASIVLCGAMMVLSFVLYTLSIPLALMKKLKTKKD